MPERLRVEALRLSDDRAPCDVAIAAGEIVGLAGLEGNGQEAFLEVLAGLRRPPAGRVLAVRDDGTTRPVDSLRGAVREGVVYLPRDRRANGIFPTLSILDNFAMASLAQDARAGLIDQRRRRRRYEDYRRALGIVAPRPERPITALSGGNQQKVLLARVLALQPRTLLLNDPTRGVDIATRVTLYGIFRDLAAQGMAVVILSTEIEEILRLSDRVLVFRDQQLAVSRRANELTSPGLVAAMFGRAA